MTTDINKLDWETHPNDASAKRAVVKFENGYSASCIKGGRFYTKGGTYEIAVLHYGGLDYTTPITSDVLGYLSEADANKALQDIKNLPKKGDEKKDEEKSNDVMTVSEFAEDYEGLEAHEIAKLILRDHTDGLTIVGEDEDDFSV